MIEVRSILMILAFIRFWLPEYMYLTIYNEKEQIVANILSQDNAKPHFKAVLLYMHLFSRSNLQNSIYNQRVTKIKC